MGKGVVALVLHCLLFFFLVQGRSGKLNGISRDDVAVVA